jgi:uncharacterized protein with von Willebrand factor type A (vWA) domain
LEERIIKFISALRAGGVRVSLAESTDALKAVDTLGIKDREAFRLSLKATLVKDASHLPIFEELFPLFFYHSQTPSMTGLSQTLSPEEAQTLLEALKQYRDQLKRMLEHLLKGEEFSHEELDKLGQMVGLDKVDDLRYREWMARRFERILHSKELREALQELLDLMDQLGTDKQRLERLQELIRTNQKALSEQLRQFAGERIAENMSNQPPENLLESLMERPLNSLSDNQINLLREQVKRLAAILRTHITLRQKRAKSGQLDAKATLRANLKHNNVPIVIKHKDRSLKPKIVVICDVSTSMRQCSELMLNLLSNIQDLINKTYAFAFIDHLEFISPDFTTNESQVAVSTVLRKMPPGHYSTDFGNSLENFTKNFMDRVDRQTNFIVVGDARNNFNDPRVDLFREISRRSHHTIWLNPESPYLWGTGDSDMLQYAPFCTRIFQVSNLSELTTAIDQFFA